MKTLLERLNPKKIAIILGSIILLLVINRLISNSAPIEEELPQEKIKAVEILEFGIWSPDSRREITGTLLSGTDVTVRAEVSGTIEKTYVTIGDTVKAGQALASFQQRNDTTQISYENLVQQLAVTQIQADSSVQSAKTALETAKRQLEQTEKSEAQNYSRTFDLLKTQAQNAESEFRNILDWADRRLMVSTSAQASVDYHAQQIGRNNTIVRQQLKNETETLLREKKRIEEEYIPKDMSDEEVLILAKDRLALLKNIQSLTRSFNTLVQGTPVTGSFSQTNKASYKNEATNFVSSIDATVLSLESQIEAAKSEQGRNRLSVLAVENAVQNSTAALAVTQAQTQAQVTQLETQLRMARSSQADLTVRAPFSGKITGKEILPYDQVTTGTPLFSIVGTDIEPKLSATITSDELARVMANVDNIKAKLEDGTVMALPEFQISGKLNTMTQKLTVDFPLEKLPDNLLVGSFVKILLPIDNTVSNLLPISAISFEPAGAETLVIEEGKGKRIHIEVGKLISNAVEINGGLEVGTKVVRYRTQAHAGEKLKMK